MREREKAMYHNQKSKNYLNMQISYLFNLCPEAEKNPEGLRARAAWMAATKARQDHRARLAQEKALDSTE